MIWLRPLLVFGGSLFGLTILCTVVWDAAVMDHLYQCSDEIGFDYLTPGRWVHGRIAYFPVMNQIHSMSDFDTIKTGWSVGRLWCLWFCFAGVSVAASVMLAVFSWSRGNTVPARLA